MNKLKRWLHGLEQASLLGERCASLALNNEDLRSKNENLWASVNKGQAEIAALTNELREIKAKAREQNEADLVLTSLKIIHRATRGETKEQLSGLASIQAQQMANYQNLSSSNYGLSGIAAGLGGIRL